MKPTAQRIDSVFYYLEINLTVFFVKTPAVSDIFRQGLQNQFNVRNEFVGKRIGSMSHMRIHGDVLDLFIFQAGRVPRQRKHMQILHKLVHFFPGKGGKQQLDDFSQLQERGVHFRAEVYVRLFRRVFQDHGVDDAEQTRHPLVPQP